MSELNAIRSGEIYDIIEYEDCSRTDDLYYPKSEADKYIALLKDKANYNECEYKLKSEELANTCRFYEDELRHHKYKRCLAMAKWCDTKGDWYYSIGESFRDRVDFYIKWRDKWLELAEKFKEMEK